MQDYISSFDEFARIISVCNIWKVIRGWRTPGLCPSSPSIGSGGRELRDIANSFSAWVWGRREKNVLRKKLYCRMGTGMARRREVLLSPITSHPPDTLLDARLHLPSSYGWAAQSWSCHGKDLWEGVALWNPRMVSTWSWFPIHIHPNDVTEGTCSCLSTQVW